MTCISFVTGSWSSWVMGLWYPCADELLGRWPETTASASSLRIDGPASHEPRSSRLPAPPRPTPPREHPTTQAPPAPSCSVSPRHVTITPARTWTISITPNTPADPPHLRSLATAGLVLPFLGSYASGTTGRLGRCFWILSLHKPRGPSRVSVVRSFSVHRVAAPPSPGRRMGVPARLG